MNLKNTIRYLKSKGFKMTKVALDDNIFKTPECWYEINSFIGFDVLHSYNRGLTKRQLDAKIAVMAKQWETEQRYLAERKARNRRKVMTRNVIQGGKWHNLPAVKTAKLTLLKGAA